MKSIKVSHKVKTARQIALRFLFLISLFLSACGFALLAALYARALIMLSLTQLGENAGLCARTLESLKSAL